ncbi:MAG TPA: hypothetical protein VEJ63_08975 [Planctomycetota bacterium]|nr:hypothetical protein [Planctomycetota bacterium]
MMDYAAVAKTLEHVLTPRFGNVRVSINRRLPIDEEDVIFDVFGIPDEKSLEFTEYMLNGYSADLARHALPDVGLIPVTLSNTRAFYPEQWKRLTASRRKTSRSRTARRKPADRKGVRKDTVRH